MVGSVVEWHSCHSQIGRFNHGHTSMLLCVQDHRPDAKVRCRVPQTGRQLLLVAGTLLHATDSGESEYTKCQIRAYRQSAVGTPRSSWGLLVWQIRCVEEKGSIRCARARGPNRKPGLGPHRICRSGHTITLVSSMAVECERTIYLLVLQSSSQRRRR